ncbi:hypothetical protein K1719_026477 [Acacia pycnantha]|nr:hypothetical protein K1719_026477 [Acacia pycnantha]
MKGKKKERVRQERNEVVLNKGEEDRGGIKGALKGLKKNTECVAESKLERYNWHEVNLFGKENLNPGEACVTLKNEAAISKEDMVMVGADEDPIKSFGMSVDEGHVSPSLVMIEPRVNWALANEIIKNWGFKHSVKREAEGFSGGIWILWNLEDLIVDVLGVDEQFIHCKLCQNNKKMYFTAVYASPSEQRRHRTWDLLLNLSHEIVEPWLLAGDFNEIKTPVEQKGGGRVNETRCRKFNNWIQECSLIDLEANGPFYTWKGPKWDGLERAYKHLDRLWPKVLLNSYWDIGNGKSVRFWYDRWLENGGVLANNCIRQPLYKGEDVQRPSEALAPQWSLLLSRARGKVKKGSC